MTQAHVTLTVTATVPVPVDSESLSLSAFPRGRGRAEGGWPHTATPHLHCEPGPGCRNLSHVVAGRSNHSVQWHTENLTRTRTQGHGILVTRKLQPVGEAARGGDA